MADFGPEHTHDNYAGKGGDYFITSVVCFTLLFHSNSFKFSISCYLFITLYNEYVLILMYFSVDT